MSDGFVVPDEVDLLSFFGSEPTRRAPADGFWEYEAADSRGVVLRFSFNTFERSVQVVVSFGEDLVMSLSHEGAKTMAIKDDTLSCALSYAGAKSSLSIRIEPEIEVRCSSLRTS